jgi:hypothetical protein
MSSVRETHKECVKISRADHNRSNETRKLQEMRGFHPAGFQRAVDIGRPTGSHLNI